MFGDTEGSLTNCGLMLPVGVWGVGGRWQPYPRHRRLQVGNKSAYRRSTILPGAITGKVYSVKITNTCTYRQSDYDYNNYDCTL